MSASAPSAPLAARIAPATVERVLVVLVALHSYAVGLMLFFAPAWASHFAGWTGDPHPAFFLRQAGVFHWVLATAYLIEHWSYRGVRVLVAAKSFALVFLLLDAVLFPTAWAVPFSGVADGAMGAVVLLAHRRAARAAAAAEGPPD